SGLGVHILLYILNILYKTGVLVTDHKLYWPAQNPELNPIERLWASHPASASDLTNGLLEKWSKVGMSMLLNLDRNHTPIKVAVAVNIPLNPMEPWDITHTKMFDYIAYVLNLAEETGLLI
uniref:Uncharacterized protein n=1 Tax=Fundulus heteroclitus TaxID=8078 RepID=A0A3Q2QFD9_FUNHE